MARKISELSKAQEARLAEFRAESLAHGLSTTPADRARAEAAFARAYRTIGNDPVPVIWMSSPHGCCFALSAMKLLALSDVPSAATRDISDQLWDQLGDQLGDRLGDQLWSQLGGQLGGQLWSQLWSQLRDQLGDQLGGRLGDQLVEWADTYWWGQQDLYWIAYYRFAGEIGVKYTPDQANRLDTMNEIAMSCMWWYPRDGLIVACDRPAAIHMDGRRRLHNVAGPAVSFRDGWSVYAVGGFRMPSWIIAEPERLSPAAIDAEQNAEIRRIMMEQFGTARYIREGGSELIASDPVHGDLYRKRRSDDSDVVMLHVRNNTVEPDGTVREFWLRVHPDCRPFRARDGWIGSPQELTPLNARASTWGLTGAVFRHLAEAA